MAIAFDSGTGSGGWGGTSWSHTTAGSNLFLAVGVVTYSGTLRTVTGITYNGVAMTLANSITAALEGSNQDAELWYLDSPATGTNTVAVTLSGAADFKGGMSSSYTGKTTTGIDANATAQSTSSVDPSPTCNVNVVHSDCWLVALGYSRGGSVSGGTGTTVRNSSGVGHAIGDSNGVVGTGNQTLSFTTGSAITWPGVCSLSFSEANAGGGGGGSAISAAGAATGTFASQASANAPISSAGTATGTFASRASAAAPISAAGQATATFVGAEAGGTSTAISSAAVASATFSSAATDAAAISMSGQSVATFGGFTFGLAQTAISMTAAASATFAGGSTNAARVSAAGTAAGTKFKGRASGGTQRTYLTWGAKPPPKGRTRDEEILALSLKLGETFEQMVNGEYVGPKKIVLKRRPH